MFMRFYRRVGDGSEVPVLVNTEQIAMMIPHETHTDCTLLKMADGDDIVVSGTLEEIISAFRPSAGRVI